MVDCYSDAEFAGLWGHENPQDPICSSSRTGFVVTFPNSLLLWVSKLQTKIDIYTMNYEYEALHHSVRALITLKSLSKEVIENLGTDSEKMKFVSRSTVYEDNNRAIVVVTSPRLTLTSNHITVKYHWSRHHNGK